MPFMVVATDKPDTQALRADVQTRAMRLAGR